jgi:hypothetical protein
LARSPGGRSRTAAHACAARARRIAQVCAYALRQSALDEELAGGVGVSPFMRAIQLTDGTVSVLDPNAVAISRCAARRARARRLDALRCVRARALRAGWRVRHRAARAREQPRARPRSTAARARATGASAPDAAAALAARRTPVRVRRPARRAWCALELFETILGRGSAYRHDIYTVAGDGAVGLVDGLAAVDGGNSVYKSGSSYVKSMREGRFPAKALDGAKAFALKDAQASEAGDLAAIKAQVGDQEAMLDSTVRARFGVARLPALLHADGPAGGSELRALLADLRASQLRKLSAQLNKPRDFALAELVASLPASLEELTLIRAAHATLTSGEVVRASGGPGLQSGEEATEHGGHAPPPLTSGSRHAAQCAAIAERVVRAMPRAPSALLEFGAGNARLSLAVALALADRAASELPPAQPAAQSEDAGRQERVRLVLVDRIVPRSKADNQLRERLGVEVARLRTDIVHLDLSRVPQLGWGLPAARCALAKHLCGEATDLALRCLAHSASCPLDAISAPCSPALVHGSEIPKRAAFTCAVEHIFVATCCHHRCLWASYVNRAALVEWGLTEETFPLFCALAQWAAETGGGSGASARGEGEQEEGEHSAARGKHSAVLRSLIAEQRIELDSEERLALGEMAKELLDAGRARFLEASGYECAWVEREFVARRVTPENRLLRAHLRRQDSVAAA